MSLYNKKYKKNSLTRFRHLFFKRASFYKQETPLCTALKASFTVEAAVTVPLFIGFMTAILFLFCILQIQMKVESALHRTAQTIAAYSCLEKKHADAVNAGTELAAAEILFRKQLEEQEVRTEYITGKSAGISLLTSDFSGEYVELKAVYQIKLPVFLLGVQCFPMHQTVKARKWTGASVTENGEEWVYITPAGTVYHRSENCPYLDLSINSVPLSEISSLRNKSGGKYQKCSQCADSGSRMVYITEYGTVYHGDIHCSGLKRTVYKVKLSETGGRRACSKCGG